MFVVLFINNVNDILMIAVAPVIRVENQLVGAPLKTNVRLDCTVESFPNSVNYWSNTKGEMILQG